MQHLHEWLWGVPAGALTMRRCKACCCMVVELSSRLLLSLLGDCCACQLIGRWCRRFARLKARAASERVSLKHLLHRYVEKGARLPEPGQPVLLAGRQHLELQPQRSPVPHD